MWVLRTSGHIAFDAIPVFFPASAVAVACGGALRAPMCSPVRVAACVFTRSVKLLAMLPARRASYAILKFVMESGAKGCQIVISGKLRGQRAKAAKFRDGYMVKSGQTSRGTWRSHTVDGGGWGGATVELLPATQHLRLARPEYELHRFNEAGLRAVLRLHRRTHT